MTISTRSTGIGLQVTGITVRLVKPDEVATFNQLMADEHALGCPRLAGHQLRYVAEHRGQAVALLSFSACAYHLADRDRWLGWSQQQAAMRRHFLVQNSRFLILKPHRKMNVASRVLGLAARRLASDWRTAFGYEALILETFVDPAHFDGGCYRAAGWTLVGRSRGFSRDGEDFYAKDSTPKDIWVKPLRHDACELLRAPALPEPLRRHERPLPPSLAAAPLQFDGLRTLFQMLQQLPESRRLKGRRYSLGGCLAIVLCATMAGCKGLRECAAFGEGLTQTQLQAIRARYDAKTGRYVAPSHSTLWRVLKGVDADAFEAQIEAWCRGHGQAPLRMAIDGKVLRATLQNKGGGECVVSAFSHPASPPFLPRPSAPPRARKSPPPKSSSTTSSPAPAPS